MTSMTHVAGPAGAPLPTAEREDRAKGWLHRAIARMISARQREADRRIADYLRGFSDDALFRLDLDEATIRRLRSGWL